jgi:hypothetical protein
MIHAILKLYANIGKKFMNDEGQSINLAIGLLTSSPHEQV